jgi:hypothetical protein
MLPGFSEADLISGRWQFQLNCRLALGFARNCKQFAMPF